MSNVAQRAPIQILEVDLIVVVVLVRGVAAITR